MISIRKVLQYIKSNRQLLAPFVVLIAAILVLIFARQFATPFSNFISVATFLTWHNLFEFSMATAFIAIFLVTFYTYNQTYVLRTILLGSMLLTAGILEVLHMLSYKGMPAFFIENTAANRATTLWIASRFMFSLAFLIAVNISDNIKCKVNSIYFLLAALLTSFVIFVSVTWYPSFLPAMYVEGYGLTTTKVTMEYIIMLMLIITSVLYFRNSLKYKDKSLILVSYALILGMLSDFTFTVYNSVYDIYNYIGHLMGVISMFMAFRSVFARNVLSPYIALTAAQNELKEHADNQEKIIEQRTRQLKMTNMRLLEDLEYARGIQKSMLPVFLPDSREISFNAVYLPTERISGDFYDIFRLDDKHLGFYISDVSGHGVPAAMLTVFLKQCIDNAIEADRHKSIIPLPSNTLQQVYEAFNHSNFSDEVYIVLIYCIYDMEEKRLICSSAGLNTVPFLVDRPGNIREMDLKGFPICKLSDVCTAEFTDFDIHIKSGDRLYLYTDGLAEARSGGGEQYTDIRLKKLLTRNREKKLSDQISIITDDLLDFCAGKKMEDDITLLAVEFRE